MNDLAHPQTQKAEKFGAPSLALCSTDWFSLERLCAGSPRQRAVYAILTEAAVFEALDGFSPCLVGTIPLDIDIPQSDADIVCSAPSLEEFALIVRERFGGCEGFSLRHGAHQGVESVVAGFMLRNANAKAASHLPVEIFAQILPVERQRAYRHLAVEARLLGLAGEEARLAIRRLKGSGMKTEPAFVAYFGIEVGNESDAFERLYDLYSASDEDLQSECKKIRKK